MVKGTRAAAAFALAGAALVLQSLPASAGTVVAAGYTIAVGGIHLGRADAVGRFIDGAYAITLVGFTEGISRTVTDANATMAANGNIVGNAVLPANYEIAMAEGGVAAEARMALRDRSVTDLHVVPGLVPSLQVVPLTIDHVRQVVDPMSALFVVAGPGPVSGETVCNRTLEVFDGWQRYDVGMSFVATRVVYGTREGYTGETFVCGARFVPVAGHDTTRPAIAYMSENARLEVTLFPVAGLGILIPYQLVVGTEIGDLVITLDRLSVAADPATVAGR